MDLFDVGNEVTMESGGVVEILPPYVEDCCLRILSMGLHNILLKNTLN